MNVYNRIVRDLVVDESFRIGGLLSIQKLMNHKLLISVFDILDFEFEKHFTFNLLGPIYRMSSSNKTTNIKYQVNSQKISFGVTHLNTPI